MGWWAGCWSRSRGRERPGTQSGRVSSARVFSGPAVREIQDELPCLAGEPSCQETKRRWRVRSRTGTTLGGRGWSRPIPWWAVQGPCFTRHRCNPHVHMSSGQLDVLHPAMPCRPRWRWPAKAISTPYFKVVRIMVPGCCWTGSCPVGRRQRVILISIR